MSSDDSEDEPLSVLAALKKHDDSAHSITDLESNSSSAKIRLKKEYDGSIAFQQYQNELLPVVERPTDVWLYLTDFNVTGPYTCLLCSEWFINRNRIVIHYVIDHKKDYCGICRYLVPNREAWTEHQKFHTPWQCSQCDVNFPFQSQLRKHFSESHKLVHCRFCYLRLPDDEHYHRHLFQKHCVTKISSINEECLWDFEYKGDQKFLCFLCSKSVNVGRQFADHFMSYHHFTLKCFMFFVAGIDLPFKVKGVDLTPDFINTQLKAYSTFGYVDFIKSLRVKEESVTVTEDAPITVDCEPELKQMSENDDDSKELELSEGVRGYRGVYDFDITLLEVITIQKCYFDYVNTTLNAINSNVMPVSSDITYNNTVVETKPINCCLCPEVFMKKGAFEAHMSKAHCVKALPIFWCRVCAAVFDTFTELETHSIQELGEFDDLWICQFCDKEFDGREDTRNHLTEHWDEIDCDNCFSPHLGFKCKFCPTLFWNETDRETHHVKVHIHKNRSHFYNCAFCGEVFGDKVFFIHHFFEKHNSETPYLLKCSLCGVVLENVNDMRSHFNKYHPEAKRLFCCLDDCKFRPFSQRKSFHIHIKSFHNPVTSQIRSETCETCGLEFSSPKTLSMHMNRVHGPGRFNCTLCNEVLHTGDERKIHYLIRHPGRSQYQCSECDKSFQYKSSLYMHKQEHSPNKKDYTCNYCGKVFVKKDSYREHIMIHEAPRHACSYCPMRFVQRSNMLRHERRHTGERPYACNYCPRTFSDKGACTSHARTHLKTTSFACVYCGQTFVQKSKLTYHIRKHTGENLETCSVCSKIFTSACSLREHMRIHQRTKMKKTVKCPFCKNMYSMERDMLRHVRTAHNGGQFKCPLCRKCLGTLGSLREHVITHSRVNTYRCKMCPKSYHVKKSIIKHVEKRHGIEPPIIPVTHYHHLDPKECDLGLDDEVMERIFGKVKKTRNTHRDVHIDIGDFVTLNKNIQIAKESYLKPNRNLEGNQSMITEQIQTNIQVKLEPEDEESEPPPPDFVNVKIESMDEDQRSDAEMS